MGIRQKIILGFLSLGTLLFFSGMMSYFELNKLSISTQTMLDASYKNMEMSKTMLDAVQDQNTALLQIIIGGRNYSRDSLLFAGREKFNSAIGDARITIRDLNGLDSIYAANEKYNQVIDDHFGDTKSMDNMEWFVDIYRTSYYNLTSAIKSLMLSSQGAIDNRAKQLERNAYRAIMPGVIALVIAILIIMMFFYFMDLYYIRPVLKITRGLGNYLTSKIPFNVNLEGRDEVHKLKEYIDELITQLKAKKAE